MCAQVVQDLSRGSGHAARVWGAQMEHALGSLAGSGAATTGLLGALLVVVAALLALRRARRAARTARVVAGPADLTAFLFAEGRLVDASPPARHLLDQGPPALPEWPRLMLILSQYFPSVEADLARLGPDESASFGALAGGAQLSVQRNGGLWRLVVSNAQALFLPGTGAGTRAGTGPAAPAAHAHAASEAGALSAELAVLRQMADAAPVLAWQEDAQGAVRWANGAYLDAAAAGLPEGEALGWPLPRLFAESPAATPGRRALHAPGADPRWFDVSAQEAGGMLLCFATPADDAARAETALARFTQTLSRTFADLPTGIAIFDQARRLVLFNPALIDICLLDPAFLSGRPRLDAVLDALRERRMIPEPRDYKAWRAQIGALERAAEEGAYRELWSLIDGRTLRVTGRPHGDGALAFLIEDVTAEMAFSRRARGDVELHQAVLDSFDEAVAVFAPDSALLIANRAYAMLWHHFESGMPLATGMRQAQAVWARMSTPGPALEALQGAMAHSAGAPAQPPAGPLVLKDGRRLHVRMVDLAGGALLVGFAPEAGAGVGTSSGSHRGPQGVLPAADPPVCGLIEGPGYRGAGAAAGAARAHR